MRKLFSLDFLGKSVFDVDIVTDNGNIVCHAGETVTPEKILKLYFRDIYAKTPTSTPPTEEHSNEASTMWLDEAVE